MPAGSDHTVNDQSSFLLDDPDHDNVTAKDMPIVEKIRRFDSSFNSRALDEQEETAEKYEVIRLALIFGGTSVY